jgi:undecaprenyl-diphosphatase
MKKKLILPSITLICFIVVMILVLTNKTLNFDDKIYDFLRNMQSSRLDFYFKNVTRLGNVFTIIIVIILLFFALKKVNKMRIKMIITIGSTVLLNLILKFIIRRPRPDHIKLIKQGGYSFPSGHAMISVALYGFLIYAVNKMIKNKILKICLTVILTIIIISIGLSRIYVGVHYPSDILA